MKSQIRILDTQQEEINDVNISQHEKEMLLHKYGYTSQTPTTKYTTHNQKNINNNLSFEELCRQHEEKERNKNITNQQKKYGPKPITFNSDDYYHDVNFREDNEIGHTFKVTIVTDMNLPK
jgi:hypothetical protein